MKKLGGLDELVLNHALISDGDQHYWAQEKPKRVLDHYDSSMKVNVNSFVHVYTAALPHLSKRDAAHVGIISSMAGMYKQSHHKSSSYEYELHDTLRIKTVSGKMTSPRQASYSASKFALDGFFGTMRQELKAQGLNITLTICFLGPIGK